MQDARISKKEKAPRTPLVILGWSLLLGGVLGLFLPFVPAAILITVGAFILNRRYAWLRQAIDQFRARFPALARALSNTERAEQQDSGATQLRRTRKALIFDENVEELALYSKPFEHEGIEVHKCASIESAMRCVEREQFDLALVDQVSPAFEGRRVIRHLVRYNWPMPFIVMAGYKNTQCFRQALELGAAEYLEKPISAAKMNGIIQQFVSNPGIDQHTNLSAGLAQSTPRS